MKKKRILSGLVGLVMLLSVFCGGVISASASYQITTTTAYNVGDTSHVTVSSKITGLPEVGEQITYLAYEDDPAGPYVNESGETNIIFIDQMAAVSDGDGGAMREFKYIANTADINSTVVRFGAQNTDLSEVSGSITAHDVNITNGDATVNIFVKNVDGEYQALGDDNTLLEGLVALEIVPAIGKKVVSFDVKIGEAYAETYNEFIPRYNGTVFEEIGNVDGNLEVTVTVEETETSEPVIKKGMNFAEEGGTNLANSIAVAYSQVIVPAGVEHSYGVILHFDEDALVGIESLDDPSIAVPDATTIVTREGIYNFKAVNITTSGVFAVKLIDERTDGSNVLKGGDFYLTPYLECDGNVEFSDNPVYYAAE